VGLGSVDPADPAKAGEFYESMGLMAMAKGVTVSVISITAAEASLENLGKVCDATGGEVDRVNPLKLQDNFAGILENAVLATQVRAKMLLHQACKMQAEEDLLKAAQQAPQTDAEGVSSSTRVVDVGNVFENTEIFFEYKQKSPEELLRAGINLDGIKQLPFQVQIHYTRLDRSKCIRVITQQRPVTTDRAMAEEHLDLGVVAANAAQRTAQLAQRGDYERGRLNNFAAAKLMARAVASPANQAPEQQQQQQQQEQAYRSWASEVANIDEMMQQQQMGERLDNVQLSSSSKAAYRSSHRSDTQSASMFRMKKSKASHFGAKK
jgi:imidazolonepropionase-like amidohydrolase